MLSAIILVVVFIDIYVPLLNFSVCWSSKIQCCVIHLETWGGTQIHVAFSTLELHFCLFLAKHTWHWILFHCISQCLLWLVSSLRSWLVDRACCPWYAVKTLKWGSVLMWGGSVCCDPLRPPANLWTTGTVGWQSVLSVTVWNLCK
jgi:hypothetical protein